MRLNPDVRKHYLKTWPVFFQAIKKRKKKFEIRLNDQDYRSGEILILQEFNPLINEYTGSNDIICLVTYVLQDERFLQKDYVCMSINILG